MTAAIFISIVSLIVALLSFVNTVWWSRHVQRRSDAILAAQNVQFKYYQDDNKIVVFNNSNDSVTVRRILSGRYDLRPTNVDVEAHGNSEWILPDGTEPKVARSSTVVYVDSRGSSWERTGRQQPKKTSKK